MGCKVVGVQRREGACPVVLTAVLCPVLLSAPDSWIYNCMPGKSHSMSNRWKHPSPNSSMALGSHVNQGKGGGSLGALGCRSQLPLSNFRRGVQEKCGVENFPNLFLKATISEWVKDENVALCSSLTECLRAAPGQRSLLFHALLCLVGSSSSCRVPLLPSSHLGLCAGKSFLYFWISQGDCVFHDNVFFFLFSCGMFAHQSFPLHCKGIFESEKDSLSNQLGSTGRYREQIGAKLEYKHCFLIPFKPNDFHVSENLNVMPSLPGDEKEERETRLTTSKQKRETMFKSIIKEAVHYESAE